MARPKKDWKIFKDKGDKKGFKENGRILHIPFSNSNKTFYQIIKTLIDCDEDIYIRINDNNKEIHIMEW